MWARLLTAAQAADYLGYKTVAVLKHLAVRPITLTHEGVGTGQRWDRRSLDKYLDTLSGLTSDPTMQTENDIFEDWQSKRGSRGA